MPDYQLSLAIGKEGQNARLAARLTGWRVDIKSETQLAEEEAYAERGVGRGRVGRSTPRPASRSGSRPRAARPSPPSSGRQATGADEAAAEADADAAAEAARRAPSRAPPRRPTSRRGDGRRGRRRTQPDARRGAAGRDGAGGRREPTRPRAHLRRLPADAGRRTSWCGWSRTPTATLAVGSHAARAGGVAVPRIAAPASTRPSDGGRFGRALRRAPPSGSACGRRARCAPRPSNRLRARRSAARDYGHRARAGTSKTHEKG